MLESGTTVPNVVYVPNSEVPIDNGAHKGFRVVESVEKSPHDVEFIHGTET